MIIYLVEEEYENVMTGVFEAWTKALECGHDNVALRWKKGYVPTLFDKTVEVNTDYEKAARVTASIRSKISQAAYIWIFRSALANDADAPDAIYRFMILGYKAGKDVTRMFTYPEVTRMMEINRHVSNETHIFMEKGRFNSINGKVYVSHIEPRCNVVTLVAEHFADRMPSEHFMIIDDNRKIAAVHPKDGENYVRYLSDEEFERLAWTENYEDQYTGLWRTFFDAIAIKERINPKCQLNHFPLWSRKHATEFMKPAGTEKRG